VDDWKKQNEKLENGNKTMERMGQEVESISVKPCKTCKETLSLRHYYRQHNPKYILGSCKSCILHKKREYYQKKKGIGALTSLSV
jgi:hypothetical protein